MKIEQAVREMIGIEQNMIENHFGTDNDLAIFDMARQALDLMGHIKDRPCEACEFKVNGDCTKWTCIFDAWLHAYGSRRDIVGKEQNDK